MDWKSDLREAKELLDDELIDEIEYEEMKQEALAKRQYNATDWKQELKEAKTLFDEGLINENDYKKLKKESLSKRQRGTVVSTATSVTEDSIVSASVTGDITDVPPSKTVVKTVPVISPSVAEDPVSIILAAPTDPLSSKTGATPA